MGWGSRSRQSRARTSRSPAAMASCSRIFLTAKALARISAVWRARGKGLVQITTFPDTQSRNPFAIPFTVERPVLVSSRSRSDGRAAGSSALPCRTNTSCITYSSSEPEQTTANGKPTKKEKALVNFHERLPT
uniref:Uncharacterized protein n=1 Tax=mine drainage metagenome TaxID=410659 RepID=E6QBH3_9ZZZZ